MKYLVIATALLTSTAAQAADIAQQKYDWSGAYIGIQAGGRWADEHLFAHVGWGPGDFYNKPTGGLIGGYAGYNYMLGKIVIGIEAGATLNSVSDVWTIQHYDYKTTAQELFTMSARLGYAIDKALVYGTAGYAHAKYKMEYFDFPSDHTSYDGYNIGAGMEYAFTSNIIGRAEYRYYDFGKHGEPHDGGRISNKQQTAILGLAYKF